MMSTTVADRGAATERVALIAASLVSFEIASSERPLSRSILPPLRNHDAGQPAFGLAGLQNTLRYRIAPEQLGVAVKLLGGQNFLPHSLQVVALLETKLGLSIMASGCPVITRSPGATEN